MFHDYQNNDDDTVRICKGCNGTGMITVEAVDRYKGLLCLWCNSTGVMTNQQYFKWKFATQRLGKSDE